MTGLSLTEGGAENRGRERRREVGEISAVVRFVWHPAAPDAAAERLDRSFRTVSAQEGFERAALDYLTEDGREAIVNLVRDRLPPGYDVTRSSVAAGNSIEILLVISAVYSVVKQFTEVVDTLTKAAEILRQVVHIVLGALGGPSLVPAASVFATADTDEEPAAPSTPAPSAGSASALLTAVATWPVMVRLLLFLTYPVLLGLGVVLALRHL